VLARASARQVEDVRRLFLCHLGEADMRRFAEAWDRLRAAAAEPGPSA
jgi:hypothetical protein